MAAPLIIHDQRDWPDQQDSFSCWRISVSRRPRKSSRFKKGSKMPGHGRHAAAARRMGGSKGPGMSMASAKPDLNDVKYDAFLANDRTLGDPEVVKIELGGRVLLRIINSSSMSAFHIDLGGLEGELIAVDGFEVVPVTAKRSHRGGTTAGYSPRHSRHRRELSGAGSAGGRQQTNRHHLARRKYAGRARLQHGRHGSSALTLALERRLRAAAPLEPRRAERRTLSISPATWRAMSSHRLDKRLAWTKETPPLPIAKGERVELLFVNQTPMPHPITFTGTSLSRGNQRRAIFRRCARHRIGSARASRGSRVRRQQPRALGAALPSAVSSGRGNVHDFALCLVRRLVREYSRSGGGDVLRAERRWSYTRCAFALACGAIAWTAASGTLATKAWSQAIRADNPAPAGQSHLTGDWGGVRSYLERNGVTLTFTDTTDFLANVSGGTKTGAVELGAVQPQLDLDLQKLVGWQGGLLHVHGLLTYGPLFSANYLGNIIPVSNIEAGPMAGSAFWYEQNGSNDLWSVRFGLMLADSQFLQSKTAANFINNGISWPEFLAPTCRLRGRPIRCPHPVFVRLKPRDDMQFQAAVFGGDPSSVNGSNQPIPLPTGTVFSFNGGAFFIAEASYLPNQSKDARGLPGAYRIGAWYHSSAHFGDQRFDDTGLSLANPQSTGAPMQHAGDGGIYGVVDQMLYRVPGTVDQGLSGFVRAGGVPQDRNLINFYADGGLLYKGFVPRRPNDKIGIAAAFARVGDNARGLDADIGFFSGDSFYPVRSSEAVIELMYQAQLKPWWMLQPDLQYVINPGGGVLNADGGLRRNAVVIGVRSLLNF